MCKQHFVLFACLAIAGSVLLAGCKKDPIVVEEEPSVELALKSAETTSAVFSLETSGVSDYAWAVYSEDPETAPTEEALFLNGTPATCADGENEFTVSGLEGKTDYILYLAAKTVDSEYYGEVLSVQFTTTDYTEPITILNTDYTAFSVHIQVPESVVESGNALRYVPVDIFTYNSNRINIFWGGVNSDASMMQSNGDPDHCVTESQTLTFDNTENDTYLHNPFAPGEPMVFMVGEYSWGDVYGNEGYLVPLFDEESFSAAAMEDPYNVSDADYWSGVYDKEIFRLREPDVLDATVKVDLDIKAVTGTIKFTPDPDVYQYCVFIMDNSTYEMMLGYLDNNEDYLQWFSTSYAAFMNGAIALEGNYELNLEDMFYEVPADSHFHMLVTAMGNAEGTAQSFQHIEFDTTPKSMEAPVVTVTPVGGEVSDDPFSVTFNVKNTGNVPVVSANYAANYIREWESSLEYMSYADIAASGNPLSAEEIERINSADGLDLTFTSIDGMTTRLAILAYNEEKTPNELDENSPAVAEQTAPDQPAAERVESSLFTDLPGEWTMTANVSAYDYYQGGYASLGPQSIKVTVFNGLDDYPETLPEDVYALYSEMDKAEVDALYEEFKLEAEAYNAKVRGLNRLLCVGFGYETSPYAFRAATPYDLFCEPNYNGYDVASLFYDFGPKWYLEVSEDGSVTVPTDLTYMHPMQAWTGGNYYLVADEIESNTVLTSGTFPVEVSSDNATITVNPMTDSALEGAYFYPNAMVDYGYYQSIYGNRIDSALTLTKGWSGDATTSISSVSEPTKGVEVNVPGLVPAARPKSRTCFPAESQVVKYNRLTNLKAATLESFEKSLDEYRQSLSK